MGSKIPRVPAGGNRTKECECDKGGWKDSF